MLVPRRMLSGAPLRARLAPAAVRTSGFPRSASSTIIPPTSPPLDASFDPLLHDISMAGRNAVRSASSYVVSDDHISPVPRDEDAGEADNDEFDFFPRREERMSPAAIVGRKSLGYAVLPQPLVEGITAAIKECDDPKQVRRAYLELLETPKHKDVATARNTYDHALARAAAFLPSQYAAVRSVLGELNIRLGGGLVPPTLEITGSLGAGLWATYDLLGPEAVQGYTLVQRTRYGLALTERFADTIPGEKQFKRDFTFIEMAQPQVVMCTFALSELPTKRGRIDLLNKLLSTGSEHIVIVDRAGDESWEAVKEARNYLLRQSTPENPLHITAPCPGEGTCPRATGKEACTFGQKLQRPLFLRKTKHGKRGDEIMAYTYLIVSRGPRPIAPATEAPVGRMGAVGKEEVERVIAKSSGRTEVREVEGGEHGNYEVVAVPFDAPKIDNTDPTDPEVQAQLRKEAYSWPRIIAPIMKRSGHMVMDVCTSQGEVVRGRIAKSHGKQEYYDGRKATWGDLYPHQFKGSTEVRTRGVRRLTPVDRAAEEEAVDTLLSTVNAEPLESTEEDGIVTFINNDAVQEFEKDAKKLDFEAPTASGPMAVEDAPFRSTGDEQLDALLQRLGVGGAVQAELVSPEGKASKKEKKSKSNGRSTLSVGATSGGKREFSTSARRMAKTEDDLDEHCALGEGGFSVSSFTDPDETRPIDRPYNPPRPKRPKQRLTAIPTDAEPAPAGEGTFALWSLSDPPHRDAASAQSKSQPVVKDEDIDEECAIGEGGFSISSLSDPDDSRPVEKLYNSPRPRRPTQPVDAATSNAEPAAAGEGGWSRWSLADPPIRSEEDLEFYFKEDPDEDCAPGEDSFSSWSLSEPDYSRPIDRKPYSPPRPKRPARPIAVDTKSEPAAAGEGGWSSWSLSDPPYRSGEKRGFSTMAYRSGGKRSFSTLTRPGIPPASLSLSRSMSVAPAERKSSSVNRPKLNVGGLHNIYASGTPITVLTAYDYPTSLLGSRAGMDIILVGDSLAQVALGYPTTVPLTLEEMAHHVRAVARGSGSSFVLADIPFGYVEPSIADGVKAAVTLMKAGADGVKIEGGREMLPLVRRLTETGIPVMSHIGLQPQRVASMGYKAQARSAVSAVDLIATAKECEDAGAFGLLLEAIPHPVAKVVTESTQIPTIGIGAGNACSGQVLVITDMLGVYDIAVPGEEDTFRVPKFVRLFANVGKESRKAVDNYMSAVRSREFPATGKETYAMPKDQVEEFARLTKQ